MFVNHTGVLGGGEIALLRVIEAIRFSDVIVILGAEGPLRIELQRLGVTVKIVPLGATESISRLELRGLKSLVKNALASGQYAFRLGRELKSLKPAVVHANSLKAGVLTGFSCRALRIPMVWHIRDRLAIDYMPLTAVRLVQFALLAFASSVIVNSNSTLETIGLARRRAQVIYDIYQPPKLNQKKDREKLQVTMVGRLARWKGQHVFIDSLDLLPEHVPPFTARIVGGALFGENEYAREVSVLASHSRRDVVLDGFRTDVAEVLAISDVVVHASVIPEPFGQVVLEAIAAGVPVVATNGGGTAEIITDGVEGFLVTPSSRSELADAIGKLLCDSQLRAKMGARGRARAFAFTPQVLAPKYVRVWCQLDKAYFGKSKT